MSVHSQTISQLDPKHWKALVLLCIANFLVMMDAAIIQIAPPSNSRDPVISIPQDIV